THSPALTRLTAAILAITPQAWTEPASEPEDATKDPAPCSPLPVAETTQPAPPECADDGGGDDKDSSLLESARLARTIGLRLAEARQIAGWTQAEAARLLGISAARLQKIERAEDITRIAFWIPRRAAEVYEVSTDFLYGLTDDWEETWLEHAYERGVSKWLFREFESRYHEQAAEIRAFGKRAAVTTRHIQTLAALADEGAAALARIRATNPGFDDLIGGATLVYKIEKLAEVARTARLELHRFHMDLGVAELPALRGRSEEVAA
ncbi:MAG: helix-turn-helix transcriptional regulator, partial [Pseudomonadota bacterium]|nr:helix-turn-helix transcriptional regulator [Pseudomonadota bacterium]